VADLYPKAVWKRTRLKPPAIGFWKKPHPARLGSTMLADQFKLVLAGTTPQTSWLTKMLLIHQLNINQSPTTGVHDQDKP
jgi:hypothetical protein